MQLQRQTRKEIMTPAIRIYIELPILGDQMLPSELKFSVVLIHQDISLRPCCCVTKRIQHGSQQVFSLFATSLCQNNLCKKAENPQFLTPLPSM